MIHFLLWLILFVLCWPLALLALVLYPLVWLVLLPFGVSPDRPCILNRPVDGGDVTPVPVVVSISCWRTANS